MVLFRFWLHGVTYQVKITQNIEIKGLVFKIYKAVFTEHMYYYIYISA